MPEGVCVCSPSIDCDTVGCNYREPHYHGFSCDNGCAYCHGKRVPVMDPENHPRHIEFKRDTSIWPGKAG